jgi:hypothetical protein
MPPQPRTRGGEQAALAFGQSQRIGDAEERLPIYLESDQDLVRIAVTFGLGDQRSELRFVSTAEMPPSLAQDSQLGVVAAAWLDGVNVRAGERLLLGYVVGPPGSLANLRVYGASASGLDDNHEVRLVAPTAGGPRR